MNTSFPELRAWHRLWSRNSITCEKIIRRQRRADDLLALYYLSLVSKKRLICSVNSTAAL